MISVQNLTKQYRTTRALDRVTIDIPNGSVFGLLGPNGSGKSTLLKLLLGFSFPTAGKITRTQWAIDQTGYVPERPSFPLRCRVQDYLATIGQLGGLKGQALQHAITTRLQQVGLNHTAQWRINTYSKGMMQRLALAQALLNDPPFLILDEPTSGLDPLWQRELRDLVKHLHQEGKTILLSTHRLDEVTELCTHIAILHRGHLKCAGPMAQVLPLEARISVTVDHLSPTLQTALQSLHPQITIATSPTSPGASTILLDGPALHHKSHLLQLLLAHGADILHLSQQRTTLESLYMEAVRS